MRSFFQYLIGISIAVSAFYIYLNNGKSYEIDSNGIDVMECGDNAAVSQQGDADFKPVFNLYNSGKQKSFSHHNKHKKMHQVKHIAFEATLSLPVVLPLVVAHNRKTVVTRYNSYYYLYFKEINPPPPRLS